MYHSALENNINAKGRRQCNTNCDLLYKYSFFKLDKLDKKKAKTLTFAILLSPVYNVSIKERVV